MRRTCGPLDRQALTIPLVWIWVINSIIFVYSQSGMRTAEFKRMFSNEGAERLLNLQIVDLSDQSHSPLTFYPKSTTRLGSRMWQYASLHGIAERTSRRAHGLSMELLEECFDLKLKQSHADEEMCRTEGRVYHPADLYFDPSVFDLKENFTCLDSFVSSWKYFGHITNKIRDLFSFKQTFSMEASKWIAERQPSAAVLVSVQVRRGDKVKEHAGVVNPITPEYIDKAMTTFTEVFGWNITFIVVSDDIDWAKVNINVTKFASVYFSEGHGPCTDAALLSSVHHSITTGGSNFGFWGAFLASGHVTYFPHWLKNDSYYGLLVKEDDFYLPHWTKIPPK